MGRRNNNLANGVHGGGNAQVLQIRAGVQLGALGNRPEGDILTELFVLELHRKDLFACGFIGQVDCITNGSLRDKARSLCLLTEETSRHATEDSIIEIKGAVGCRHDDYALILRLHAIPLGHDFIHDFAASCVRVLLAVLKKRVNLIQENNTRGDFSGKRKDGL